MYFVSADVGFLKFRHFVDLSIEEDVFYAGREDCRKDDFVSWSWAFTFQLKIHFMKTTNILVCGQNITHRYLHFLKEDYSVQKINFFGFFCIGA